MSHNTAPQMDVVRLEEKEDKLKIFISSTAQRWNAAQTSDRPAAVLVIARSAESPVFKALVRLVEEAVLDMPVKVVFSALEAEHTIHATETMPATVETRVVRDHRICDAHEQLVLGTATCWIGDCMRRDPLKRDAYECYAADCATTAAWARISFERLWTLAETTGGYAGIATVIEGACMAQPSGDGLSSDTDYSSQG